MTINKSEIALQTRDNSTQNFHTNLFFLSLRRNKTANFSLQSSSVVKTARCYSVGAINRD
ncbi:hypothetical protein HanRHA438_Chr15g0689531 [Helianthus annuus]|nr:hypothetical protein HanIR_Chr15g0735681 [Helianthus annuus]KAJ0843268.1 hypothetical protein HanRHA438_Chr15g0689531 [Helianthus annuus]